MNIEKTLLEQFEEANKNYERAKEIEVLTHAHSDICKQIVEKNRAANEKRNKGQVVTVAEQLEISKLGEQQANAYRKLADKVLSAD